MILRVKNVCVTPEVVATGGINRAASSSRMNDDPPRPFAFLLPLVVVLGYTWRFPVIGRPMVAAAAAATAAAIHASALAFVAQPW